MEPQNRQVVYWLNTITGIVVLVLSCLVFAGVYTLDDVSRFGSIVVAVDGAVSAFAGLLANYNIGQR